MSEAPGNVQINVQPAIDALGTAKRALNVLEPQTPFTRSATSFAEGNEELAAMYDDTRANMLTEHQALDMLITTAAEAFSRERGTDAYERRMAALHYAAMAFGEYTLEEADFAFGRGAR